MNDRETPELNNVIPFDSRSRNLRVLIVDDVRLIADTLKLILSSAGYESESAYDGRMGLEVCRRMQPDLLISDVVMPKMSGIELAIAIRQELRNTHILLFSGEAVTEEMVVASRAHGYDFELLAKPIHPRELLEEVCALIGSPHRSNVPDRRKISLRIRIGQDNAWKLD